jgi:hypothetical protein
MLLGNGQSEGSCGSAAGRTVEAQPSTDCLGETQAERQAGAHPFEPPCRAGVSLVEWLANLSQDLRVHAGTRVLDYGARPKLRPNHPPR